MIPSANGSPPDLENGNGYTDDTPKEEEEEKPQLSVWMTVGLLVVVTVVRETTVRNLPTIDCAFRSWSP